MKIGFHTTGLLLHDEASAVTELAALGYECVAIRPRLSGLNPQDAHFGETLLRVGGTAAALNVQLVIDTDALFMHDPKVALQPSLVAEDPSDRAAARRWIEQWVTAAGELPSRLVTFSSGTSSSGTSSSGTFSSSTGGNPDNNVSDEQSLECLAGELDRLLLTAQESDVRLALQPKHGRVIATVAQFERLGQWLDDPSRLMLAADVGEMLMGHEFPIADRLARNLDRLACVYLCDRRSGASDDQRIGQGDVALARIVRSLREHEFDGPAIVRVEGHSELGLTLAVEAMPIFED